MLFEKSVKVQSYTLLHFNINILSLSKNSVLCTWMSLGIQTNWRTIGVCETLVTMCRIYSQA